MTAGKTALSSIVIEGGRPLDYYLSVGSNPASYYDLIVIRQYNYLQYGSFVVVNCLLVSS